MSEALLVACGAVPGAWLRLRLINHFEPLLPRRHWSTLLVNASACFALGLVVALEGRCGTTSAAGGLSLWLATGFLGSLSTFSTLAVELLQVVQRRERLEALLLAGGSVLLGLGTLHLGLLLGRL